MTKVTITLDESVILSLPQDVLAEMVLAMAQQNQTLPTTTASTVPLWPDLPPTRGRGQYKPIPWTAQDKEMLFFLRDEVKDTWQEIGKVLNRRPETCSRMYFETRRKAA